MAREAQAHHSWLTSFRQIQLWEILGVDCLSALNLADFGLNHQADEVLSSNLLDHLVHVNQAGISGGAPFGFQTGGLVGRILLPIPLPQAGPGRVDAGSCVDWISPGDWWPSFEQDGGPL